MLTRASLLRGPVFSRRHYSIAASSNKMDATTVAGFKQRLDECNASNPDEVSDLVSLVIDSATVGRMTRTFAEHLTRWKDVFSYRGTNELHMNHGINTVEKRTESMAVILSNLRDEGIIQGWRDEMYAVSKSFYDAPYMLVERAAAVQLGIKAYGIHVNGYVLNDKGLCLWVAKRSPTKQTWPGKLDHIAAGGQPHGLSVMENVLKECEEEASIPRDLAQNLVKPVGAVSYMTMDSRGLKQDVLFVFDIQLPPSFTPTPCDGEVESFQLLPISEVARIVSTTTDFKTNCSLVIIDFMVRHGVISPDSEGYLDLVSALRKGDCS